MSTISLCMIVRNEEDVLDHCLRSVSDLVDEIIIVDTGSDDRTREIAAAYTEKVYDFLWGDDFAAARNFSFSKASCDYCMWLDADDILTEPDRQKFAAIKADLTPAVDVVMMRYHTGFDESGNVTFSYYRERIIKNHAGMRWKGAVHEVIDTHGNTIYSDCAVTHRKLHPSDPDRNLRIFEALLQKGDVLDPRQQFYYARELYYHRRYADALRVLEHFLDAGQGWLENQIDACRHYAWCLYGLEQPERALQALFRSFTYDLPRAEICCDIGRHFFDRERWAQAIYWYSQALGCQRQDDRGGFISPDDYGYTPCLQLCVCYSRLGQNDKAKAYNEQAARYKPNSPAIAHNRVYFQSLQQA